MTFDAAPHSHQATRTAHRWHLATWQLPGEVCDGDSGGPILFGVIVRAPQRRPRYAGWPTNDVSEDPTRSVEPNPQFTFWRIWPWRIKWNAESF